MNKVLERLERQQEVKALFDQKAFNHSSPTANLYNNAYFGRENTHR